MLAVLLFSFALSSEPFRNTPAHTKYAAWSIVSTMNGSLVLDIGKVKESLPHRIIACAHHHLLLFFTPFPS